MNCNELQAKVFSPTLLPLSRCKIFTTVAADSLHARKLQPRQECRTLNWNVHRFPHGKFPFISKWCKRSYRSRKTFPIQEFFIRFRTTSTLMPLYRFESTEVCFFSWMNVNASLIQTSTNISSINFVVCFTTSPLWAHHCTRSIRIEFYFANLQLMLIFQLSDALQIQTASNYRCRKKSLSADEIKQFEWSTGEKTQKIWGHRWCALTELLSFQLLALAS